MEKRKNIHLLATDKGQRITKTSKGTLLWCSKSAEDFIETRKGYLGFHLYITNDEEIKEGDWCYDVALKVFQASHNFNGYNNNLCKKIILTTDQDLIKDNVQAIDNEFLEWFVKNSSCESVEIGEGVRYEDEWIDNEDGGEIFQHQYCCYKIIIPIEEPKRTHYLDELPNIDKDTLAKMWEATIPRVEPKREVFLMNAHGVLDTREPKQETLEVKRNYEKHSLTKTKGYKLWCNIIQRCYNPKNHSYKYYGEKGVIMEDYFKNSYENFINWIKGIANYEKWLNSSELSLDRIDNTLGYVRGNIKFSTKTEQVENQNLRLDNKSGYKGVCYHKLNKKYGATITINKSKVFLGYYDTALEAALVYDNYVLKNNLNRKTNL